MTPFNYHDKFFVGIVNYEDGDLTADTLFHYRHEGEVVWGTYVGGNVLFGTLVARVLEDGQLDMVWQYLNKEGKFRAGTCRSTPEILPDGRYRLHEHWEVITDNPTTGFSIIEETSK